MLISPCYPSQVDPKAVDEAFTKGNVAKLLRYAQDNYFGKGIDYLDAIDDMSRKFNIPRSWLSRAIGSEAAVRADLNNAYIQTRARAFARQYAALQAKWASLPQLPGLLGTIWNGYRALKVLFHGPVFPFTHAFDLAKMGVLKLGAKLFAPSSDFANRPLEMARFWKTVARSWGAMRSSYHRAVMEQMIDHPRYEFWKRMGLVIDPRQGPIGILGKKGNTWAAKAWDMLKPGRLELADAELFDDNGNIRPKYANVSKPEFEEMARNVADDKNHMTGAVSRGREMTFGSLSPAMFAPELTAAKWHALVADNAKATALASKLGGMTSADKQFVGMIARRNGELIAGRALSLAANDALLRAGLLSFPGQKKKQEINYDNPLKADWLRPKAFGQVYNMRGQDEIVQFMGKMIAIAKATDAEKKKLGGIPPWQKNVPSATDLWESTAGQYGFSKLHPTAEKIKELLTAEDYSGRPLPWSSKAFGKYGPKYSPRFTYPEYTAESLAPIFAEGAVREAFEAMRDKGLDTTTATNIIRGLADPRALVTGTEEFAGIGVYNEEH